MDDNLLDYGSRLGRVHATAGNWFIQWSTTRTNARLIHYYLTTDHLWERIPCNHWPTTAYRVSGLILMDVICVPVGFQVLAIWPRWATRRFQAWRLLVRPDRFLSRCNVILRKNRLRMHAMMLCFWENIGLLPCLLLLRSRLLPWPICSFHSSYSTTTTLVLRWAMS